MWQGYLGIYKVVIQFLQTSSNNTSIFREKKEAGCIVLHRIVCTWTRHMFDKFTVGSEVVASYLFIESFSFEFIASWIRAYVCLTLSLSLSVLYLLLVKVDQTLESLVVMLKVSKGVVQTWRLCCMLLLCIQKQRLSCLVWNASSVHSFCPVG